MITKENSQFEYRSAYKAMSVLIYYENIDTYDMRENENINKEKNKMNVRRCRTMKLDIFIRVS